MADNTDGVFLQQNGIKLLEKCPKEQAPKFIHEVLDGICDGREPRYLGYGKIWSIEEWKQVSIGTHDTLKNFVSRGLSKEQVSQELDRFSLSPDMKQVVTDCLRPRQDEIRAVLISNTAGITSSHLKDFDWKLKLILASDKLANIRKPVVSVDFDIAQPGSDRQVTVELTQDELKNLITSLEAANKMIVQLKG